MISTHEVRIGNYVKCTRGNDAGIYRVHSLDGKMLKIMLDGAREGEWLRDEFHTKPEVKGIKITQEWLLQLGFKKPKNVSVLQVDSLYFIFDEGLNFQLIQYIDIGAKEQKTFFLPYKIKYVHQL